MDIQTHHSIIPIVGERFVFSLEMKLTSRLLFPTPESPISRILKEKSHLLFLCPIFCSSSSSLLFQNRVREIRGWKLRKRGFGFPSSLGISVGGGVWRGSCGGGCLGLHLEESWGTNGRLRKAGSDQHFCLHPLAVFV